jgi:hypothetical protein
MIAALFSPLKFRVAIGTKNLLSNVDFEWIKVVDFFELSSLGRLAMSTEVLGTQT